MSNAIKYWRKHNKVYPKMSQQKLADLINIDRPTLSKIENPDISIDPDEAMALKIARIFSLLITDILRKPPEEIVIKNENNIKNL